MLFADDSTSDHWAVIVAGSKDYWNYRHQADACHAYHILKKNGISDDKIILFSYDDVAHDRDNPFRGKLFNKPDGMDLNEGCKIDYRRGDVTPEKFVKAITADEALASAGGKVLRSTKESKVFMYLTKHGATGLLAFPNQEYLYANELVDALKVMHDKGMYGEMVIYIESSEASSIFEGILPANIKILGLAAAEYRENAFATYCYPDDMVNGRHMGTCLGN